MGWSPISHRAIRADRCWHGCLCRARCPGLGGFAAFFAYSALLTLAIILIALAVISFFAGGNLSPGVREGQPLGPYRVRADRIPGWLSARVHGSRAFLDPRW